MSQSLPAHASLVHLRHQAKDLRTGARRADPGALSTMRLLRRYSGATDAEIAAARVTLGEAQLALALSYGSNNWAELKRRVENPRDPRAHVTRRPDGALVIQGFEEARWGTGDNLRQCSSIATLSLISERLGGDTDYDYLMGASAAAFRVQMSEGQLCPSSPHARCGFDCGELAFRAWGNEVDWLATDDGHAGEREAARARIAGSVEAGVPVIYEQEESSLFVGVGGGELLLRANGAQTPGYAPMQAWPWLVGLPSPRGEAPDRRAVLADSLRIAVQLFETPQVGRYMCGGEAYRHWQALLEDQASLDAMPSPQRQMAMVGNAHTLSALGDARGAAFNYLSAMAEHAPEAVRPALGGAAERYAEMEARIGARRRELAPFPWETESAWSDDARRRQIEELEALAEIDAAAVAQLKQAATALQPQP